MPDKYQVANLFKPRVFPWWVVGRYYLPKIGGSHSYLVEIMQPWIDPAFKEFAKGRPTLREIESAGKYCEVLKSIADYSIRNSQKDNKYKKEIEEEVLEYLENDRQFFNWFKNEVDKLVATGKLTMPSE